MKIVSSMVAMRSQHSRMEVTEERESLRVRTRQPEPSPPATTAPARPATSSQTEATGLEGDESTSIDDLKLGLLKMLLERISGIKIKVLSTKELRAKLQELRDQGVEIQRQVRQPTAPQAQAKGNFALAYDYSFTHTERETTQVQMAAEVHTSDGKTIQLGIQLNLSRELVQHQEFHLTAGDQSLFDPLVINFEGSSAELTQRQFQFDLNVDGKQDQIAFLKPGSGFLALDKNGDGKINDGSELFGPRSGDGYQELASYDQDGNLFIDEGDAIYQQLQVWSKDANGTDRLMAIGEAGVGAIYLGHIGSEFTLADGQQQTVGQLRDTGFFLREDGSAGTVQQIDLVV